MLSVAFKALPTFPTLFSFFLKYLFFYLAVLGLRCGTQDLSLWCTDSLVVHVPEHVGFGSLCTQA